MNCERLAGTFFQVLNDTLIFKLMVMNNIIGILIAMFLGRQKIKINFKIS